LRKNDFPKHVRSPIPALLKHNSTNWSVEQSAEIYDIGNPGAGCFSVFDPDNVLFQSCKNSMHHDT
jgi:hypothetical protein